MKIVYLIVYFFSFYLFIFCFFLHEWSLFLPFLIFLSSLSLFFIWLFILLIPRFIWLLLFLSVILVPFYYSYAFAFPLFSYSLHFLLFHLFHFWRSIILFIPLPIFAFSYLFSPFCFNNNKNNSFSLPLLFPPLSIPYSPLHQQFPPIIINQTWLYFLPFLYSHSPFHTSPLLPP